MLPPGPPQVPPPLQGFSLSWGNQGKSSIQKYPNPRHFQGCSSKQRSEGSQPQPFRLGNCLFCKKNPKSPCTNQQLIMNTNPSAPGQTQHMEEKMGAPGGSPSPCPRGLNVSSSSTRLLGKSHQSAANRQGLTDDKDEASTNPGHQTLRRWADTPQPQPEFSTWVRVFTPTRSPAAPHALSSLGYQPSVPAPTLHLVVGTLCATSAPRQTSATHQGGVGWGDF